MKKISFYSTIIVSLFFIAGCASRTISNENTSPEPTPEVSPTPAPSESPLPTPTPSETPAPSESPSPTPAPAVSPTITPTATPTPTPAPKKSETYTSDINNFSFNPPELKIKKGDTVIWTNSDSAPHTITSDAGNELGSSTLSSGQTYKHTFNTAGTFNYHCSIHPSMKANVVVK